MIKKLNTIEELCNNINVKVNFLKYVLFVKKNNYRQFTIPKRNGEFRTILAPLDELKYIQKKLLLFLENNYSFLNCQHGFIKGKSCITNAKNHVGKRYVLTLDIENFFDNIHFGRVKGLFEKKPFNYSPFVSTIIAKIVCYGKRLPQGAPTSPFISNMICYSMDKRFEGLASHYHCKYTRYADDITFSTNAESFPTEIAFMSKGKVQPSTRVTNILSGGFKDGFKLNESKSSLFKNSQRQEVTGIIVNRKTNLNSLYVKKIRAILYNIKINGFIEAYKKTFTVVCKNEEYAKRKMFNYLLGKISYLQMVKSSYDNTFIKYANQFNQIFEKEIFDIKDEEKVRKYAVKRCYVIECFGNGTGFSLSDDEIITSTHVILSKDTCQRFISNEKDKGFKKQFPLSPEAFVYLKHPNLKREKPIVDISIDYNDYSSDISRLKIKVNNKNHFKKSKRRAKLGDEVYMIGYPSFIDFNRSSLHVIKTKVIGENICFNRKIINTEKVPGHGMSGGPVLNEKMEVVGIVYAGNDDVNINNDNVGFISLV